MPAMYLHYYVYAYLRKSNLTPYYIGKGSGNRMFSNQHLVSVPKDKTKIVILESNLSEVGALAIERRMIRWWGRKDLNTGILHNKTDGGDGVSGIIPWHKGIAIGDRLSDSGRDKISQAHKNKIVTNEVRKKLSDKKVGKNNFMFGKTHSEETKSKIRSSMAGMGKGRTLSIETRNKMRESHLKRLAIEKLNKH